MLGTAADIIEFFDSFKDDKIASEPILVLLTLAIWSWSLMQFTVVLTATKSRKSRLTTTGNVIKGSGSCCSIDVWGIALNITLQDAPFLVFRLLLITHFQIISYMNVFFTCKNTLVILLQMYRLYVVYSEHHKAKKKARREDFELTNISIISKNNMDDRRGRRHKAVKKRSKENDEDDSSESNSEDETKNRKTRKMKNSRKDTGYSTGSSHNSSKNHLKKQKHPSFKEKCEPKKSKQQKLKRSDNETRGRRKLEEAFSEESESDFSPPEEKKIVKEKSRGKEKKYEKEPTVSISTSDPSSE